MSSERPCWEIYNAEMSRLNNGHALWQPAPLSYFDRVRPGDVGYIREGCFNLLFSATSPPHPLKKLDVGRILNPQPQDSGYLTGCRETRVDSKPSASPSSEYPVPALQSGSNFKFLFTEEQGAALVTKYQTYKENVQAVGNFEKFTKENYASWVEYARNDGHGDVNPVLVTGVDRTKDFSMMCYSNYDDGLECEFQTSIPGTASASPWGTWKSSRFIYTNHGPQLCRPPSSTPVTNATSSDDGHPETVPDDYNQCTFVRYFTMRYRRLWVPKIIKAGAGPHDLGSGDRENEGSPPGIEDNSDSSSDRVSSLLSCDGDDGGLASSIDSGSDIVVHNPTIDKTDDFDVIADYIFQNSHSKSVLLHHRDFALLREPGGSTDLHTQLLERQPQILVDENGVGTIWFQESGPTVRPPTTAPHNLSPLSRPQAKPPISASLAPSSTGVSSICPIATPPTPDPSCPSHAVTPGPAPPLFIRQFALKTAGFTSSPPYTSAPFQPHSPLQFPSPTDNYLNESIQFDEETTNSRRKRRRTRTTQSCQNCHTSKRKCDRGKPCSRCIQLGLASFCVYEVDDPAIRDDPSDDEITTLRNRIAELENLVRELREPRPRWADDDAINPSADSSDVSEKWHTRTPKKSTHVDSQELTIGTDLRKPSDHLSWHRPGMHTHPSNDAHISLPPPLSINTPFYSLPLSPPGASSDWPGHALDPNIGATTTRSSCRCLSDPSVASRLSNLSQALHSAYAFLNDFAGHNNDGCVVIDRIADLGNLLLPNTSYDGAPFVANRSYYHIPHLTQPFVPSPSLYNQEFSPRVHRSLHQYPSTTRTPAIDIARDKMTSSPVTTAYPTPPDPFPVLISQTPMTPDTQRFAIWHPPEIPAEFKELAPIPIIPVQSQAFNKNVGSSAEDLTADVTEPPIPQLPQTSRLPSIWSQPWGKEGPWVSNNSPNQATKPTQLPPLPPVIEKEYFQGEVSTSPPLDPQLQASQKAGPDAAIDNMVDAGDPQSVLE